MKILFLDIDGPLIPLRIHVQKGYGFFGYSLHDNNTLVWDKEAVAKIVAAVPDAKIVFNSSHNAQGTFCIRLTAITNGFPESMLHENIITKYPFTEVREAAIYEWLRENIPPGTTYNWVSVDDFKLNLGRNFVHVSLEEGLTDTKLEKIFRKLKDKRLCSKN